MKLIADPLPWTVDAACLTAGPEIFFPEGTSSQSTVAYKTARTICANCDVATACLDLALEAEGGASRSNRHGMYGGMSPTERWDLARGRRAA